MIMLSTPMKSTMELISGVGHMWYLPMLFWCFLAMFFIEKQNLKPGTMIVLLVVMALISSLPLPVRLNSTMYYMLFFFAGYAIKRYSVTVDQFAAPKWIIGVFAIYTLALITVQCIKPLSDSILTGGLQYKIFSSIIRSLYRLLYAIPGAAMIYLMSYWLVYKKELKLDIRLINLSACCFGIYLFQQFILKWIYYNTPAAQHISIAYLPWIAFLLTLIMSYLLTKACLKTRLGRFLIG